MTRIPTARQLEVLKYLSVGMHLDRQKLPNSYTLPVICKGVEVIRVQIRTVLALRAAGWIDENLMLTAGGRAVAECKTFVRAFAEAAL